jgi:two-component system CheB/CheR fusion protein
LTAHSADSSPARESLVVIGSSAGGIDALSTLVASLPADFPAPIVIAQHLDPRRQSVLPQILARRSAVPVHTVETLTPLRDGVIFVVPANRHVLITDSAIDVRVDGDDRPTPSIDLLLETAAARYGEQLIAVILTGMGSDGAAGAHAVKKAGGTIVIQNPDTATHPSMPRSLAPSIVDIVADIERIGPILVDLLRGVQVPTRPEEDRALTAFLTQVREQRGIDFRSYKQPTIRRRLQRRIVATDSGDIPGYLDYLAQRPEEYQQLVSTFLIKVTEFFRDPELFDYLRATILPELLARAEGHDRELRIWSAGCATGEEAYSLAILVAELLGHELAEWNIRIFATDLDAEAINFARQGIYSAATVEGLPDGLLGRCFTSEDGVYQIRKHIRALTIFGQHDLGQRAPFPRIDLVVCRNVLIYFTQELQQRALQLFAYSLRHGGLLVLGKAESPSPLGEFFALEQQLLKVYRRQGERILMPTARLHYLTPRAEVPPARTGARATGGTRASTGNARRRHPASAMTASRAISRSGWWSSIAATISRRSIASRVGSWGSTASPSATIFSTSRSMFPNAACARRSTARSTPRRRPAWSHSSSMTRCAARSTHARLPATPSTRTVNANRSTRS